ncbi:MAG: amidohydrolase family protein [Chloroflexi bacterium]|nr:amidohydrolase family protein [Chloroflexota bacterium]
MADKRDYPEVHFVEEYEPGDDACVELKNCRFLDVVNGCYFLPQVGVIVQGKKIKAMPGLPGEPRNITPDFIVDLKGKTVLPGLFNTHCHAILTTPSLLFDMHASKLSRKYREKQMAKSMAECLAHGITNIRDAWGDDLRPSRALRDRIFRKEIWGPRILQAVVVTQPGGYMSPKVTPMVRLLYYALGMPIVDHEKDYSGVVVFPMDANERQVRDAVDRAIDERGADLIKIGEQRENLSNFKPDATIMTLEQMEALTDQAWRRNVKATMHHTSVESFRRGVKSGVSSLAHIPANARLTQADVEAFKSAGCIVEPTLSVAYDLCWKVRGNPYNDHPDMDRVTEFRDKTWAALANEYWIPELRDSVMKAFRQISTGKLKAMGIIDTSVMYKYYSSMISDGVENFRMLFEQGALIACGNDGGIPMCTPAMIGHEINMFDLIMNKEPDDIRFSGADAVRIATINSAYAMGLEKEFGSIETGKTADLAIVDGDPLEDLHVLGSRVAALFMDGRLIINNCGFQLESGRKV